MIITLKDGSKREYAQPMSAYDIARDISEGLARVACMAEIDGKAVDLRTMVDKDCELNILTFDSDEGKRAYRHTCSHVLAEAVKNLYPDAKLAIGPSIENGFYYDFDMPSLSREDLDKIEADIIERDHRDMTREISPLKQADDATLIDSSDMTIDEVVDAILALCN